MAQDVFLHWAAWWSKSAVAESQRHRRLWQSLSHHFRVAHECPIEFLRTSLGLPEGVLGIVMAIHTFGVPARAPLRVVFQQDARPAGQAWGRTRADRGVTP
jgi:hypothetical protein